MEHGANGDRENVGRACGKTRDDSSSLAGRSLDSRSTPQLRRQRGDMLSSVRLGVLEPEATSASNQCHRVRASRPHALAARKSPKEEGSRSPAEAATNLWMRARVFVIRLEAATESEVNHGFVILNRRSR
jgi:hypothetical protein